MQTIKIMDEFKVQNIYIKCFISRAANHAICRIVMTEVRLKGKKEKRKTRKNRFCGLIAVLFEAGAWGRNETRCHMNLEKPAMSYRCDRGS